MNFNEPVDITKFLRKKGTDIIGYTSVKNNIPSIPEDFTPSKILNQARSIVCYAFPIPKGVIFANSQSTLVYWRYCNMMYRSIDAIANSLCVYLEDDGYLSTPIYSCYPWKINDREFWGLTSLVYWGEKAGLGKLTRSGLLGHPKYGTRILLGGVITSKSIVPSKLIQTEICPSDCMECINACPAKAIDKTGKVNHNLCIRKANSNPLMTHLLKDEELRKTVNFETIMNTVGIEDHSSYLCLECLKSCPLNF